MFNFARRSAALVLGAVAALIAGCSTYPAWLPTSGPSVEQVRQAPAAASLPGIQVLDVTPELTARLIAAKPRARFSDVLNGAGQPQLVGPGDAIEISVWEAPPASLFGANLADLRTGSATARVTLLPDQQVNTDGTITVPFAGTIRATGRTAQQIESDVVARLKGKANQPQVLARVVRNATNNVTVVGDVAQSIRMPLTPRGERLLDALAAAGGVRQPVGKISIQVTRGLKVLSMPLDAVIADPGENVTLQPGDVVTALHQPFSLTVLGATGSNRELEFEAQGISLSQALGRAGGLQDQRADARGLFIFRFEDAAVLPPEATHGPRTPKGLVPVVYRIDLLDPSSFFTAQDFPMRNKDVVYVANAPSAELQKFLNIVGSVMGPLAITRAVAP